MSFYSSIIFAANTAVRATDPPVMQSVLSQIGLLELDSNFPHLKPVANSVSQMFRDSSALRLNPNFFCPDSIGFNTRFEIIAEGGDYSGEGFSISIHGNGYFYPWEFSDLQERILGSTVLQALSRILPELLGGRFDFPPTKESFLRSRMIVRQNGWAWFASESL